MTIVLISVCAAILALGIVAAIAVVLAITAKEPVNDVESTPVRL